MRRDPRTDSTSTSAPAASSAGVGVAGRGGGAEVAADAAAVADLRGGDRVGGEGEARQLGAQVLHDPGVRDGGAQPHALLADLPVVKVADAVQVHEVVGPTAVEVDLDHHVGAARDRHGGGVLGLRGERLLPAGGAKEVHDRLSSSSRGGVRIEPIRVRRARLAHVLFTRSGLSTPPCTPPVSVTETMKELAGQ
ncbi:hypothetical protein GCM10019016_128560 [Streptomyces prasinosporus]|uniref:Uncharacterized protein n=1 Tax=Streptomyces prasinosporus TaxID=68256 RepID=A0ABP6UD94_9ACTN